MKAVRRLSGGDKNRLIILFAAAAAALFFGLRYQPLTGQLQAVNSQISRRLDRLSRRSDKVPPVSIPVNRLRRESAEMSARLPLIADQLQRLKQNFISLEDPKAMQALLLEISELAGAYDLDVLKVTGITRVGNEKVETLSDALKQQTRNVYGRPLTLLQARGSFQGFLGFLDGLGGLSQHVVVVRLGIQSQKTSKRAAGTTGLVADLLLAM